MLLKQNARILIIGDSISDCGRMRPIGEEWNLGTGYPSLFHARLRIEMPEKLLRIINMGTSGDTVRLLEARWETDVIALKPDVLCIMIGANDVWRSFDHPAITEAKVDLEDYEAVYRSLIDRSKAAGIQNIVLMTPFFLETNRSDYFRAKLDRYGDAVRRIAADCGLVLADVQAAFDRYFERGACPMTISGDRVHPNLTGHMIIADCLLEALKAG